MTPELPQSLPSMDLTDEQWALIEQILVAPVPGRRGRGRPSQNVRSILNGIFWEVRTGAPWANLSSSYPSQQTCRRYFRLWQSSGALNRVVAILTRDLSQRGGLSIQTALQQGDIRININSDPPTVLYADYLQNTWQVTLASLLLRLALKKAAQISKHGRSATPSVWSAL